MSTRFWLKHAIGSTPYIVAFLCGNGDISIEAKLFSINQILPRFIAHYTSTACILVHIVINLSLFETLRKFNFSKIIFSLLITQRDNYENYATKTKTS